jgi:hypothetical protein
MYSSQDSPAVIVERKNYKGITLKLRFSNDNVKNLPTKDVVPPIDKGYHYDPFNSATGNSIQDYSSLQTSL